MPWSVDHGPTLICMTISNVSQFRLHLETLQTTSDSELLKAIWSDNQEMYHIIISLIQVSDFWPTWVSSFNCTASLYAKKKVLQAFLFLQHFSDFLLSSPHCFTSVFVWFYVLGDVALMSKEPFSPRPLPSSPPVIFLLTFPKRCFYCGLLFMSSYVFACNFYFGWPFG